MSITGDLIRGHTDAIILARLLQSDSYGYEINKTISTLSSGRFELRKPPYTRLSSVWKNPASSPPTGVTAEPEPGVGITPSPLPEKTLCTGFVGSGKKRRKSWISS